MANSPNLLHFLPISIAPLYFDLRIPFSQGKGEISSKKNNRNGFGIEMILRDGR
jgi:hypothetical protein